MLYFLYSMYVRTVHTVHIGVTTVIEWRFHSSYLESVYGTQDRTRYVHSVRLSTADSSVLVVDRRLPQHAQHGREQTGRDQQADRRHQGQDPRLPAAEPHVSVQGVQAARGAHDLAARGLHGLADEQDQRRESAEPPAARPHPGRVSLQPAQLLTLPQVPQVLQGGAHCEADGYLFLTNRLRRRFYRS